MQIFIRAKVRKNSREKSGNQKFKGKVTLQSGQELRNDCFSCQVNNYFNF